MACTGVPRLNKTKSLLDRQLNFSSKIPVMPAHASAFQLLHWQRCRRRHCVCARR
jgi:hypothetical protein